MASKMQVQHMFDKFIPEKKEDFVKFYKLIKKYKFTTAIIQQYFMWNMENYENIYEDIELFEEICRKNNYDETLDLYS